MQPLLTRASPRHAAAITVFLARFATAIRESAVSDEMLCSSGIRAAVARREMLIAIDGKAIVAAARIYRRKTRDALSLYQFAVDEPFRRHRLLVRLLSTEAPAVVEAICRPEAPIESYFRHNGWRRKEAGPHRAVWLLSPVEPVGIATWATSTTDPPPPPSDASAAVVPASLCTYGARCDGACAGDDVGRQVTR